MPEKFRACSSSVGSGRGGADAMLQPAEFMPCQPHFISGVLPRSRACKPLVS